MSRSDQNPCFRQVDPVGGVHSVHTPYARNGAHSVQTEYKEESYRIPLKEKKEASSSLCVFSSNHFQSLAVG